MKKLLQTAVSIVLALMCVSSIASADGVLIPVPGHDHIRPPPYFSIKYHRVTVDINDQAARTTVDQVFVNDTDRDLEGDYLFPVPKGASVSSFAMWMNGEKVTGRILTAEEARRTYLDIVRRLKDPGLLEYAGRDLFRARVYPIPRRGEVRIAIAYEEMLRLDAATVRYRYPLDTERFSPRPIEDVSLVVNLHSTVPLKAIYSPTHDIDIERSRHEATCGFENSNVRPDKDFILYYTVAAEQLGAQVIAHRYRGEDGYFTLLLSPGSVEHPGEVLAKDVIFVIDKSGSMQGEKLAQAKGALEYCLDRLNYRDHFNIITFSSGILSFDSRLVPVSRGSRTAAREFVHRIEARGGTDIDRALGEALAFSPSGNPRLVIFLTDGLPTVGETDIGDVLEHVRDANTGAARIFVFGVGFDVNTHLLDRLAMENRGTVDYVIPGEDIEETVSSFFIKANNPVLSDLTIDFGGIDVYDCYPGTLPDLFEGSQLVLFGRYRGSGQAAITLNGSANETRREFVFENTFPRTERDNDFIPRLWASRKIAYLLTEIRLHGEQRELIDEVIALSKEYGIITPYTSFLIAEKGTPDDRRWIMPHAEAMAPAMKEAGNGFALQTGRDAVMLDKHILAAQDENIVAEPELATVEHVGRKTFYRTDDEWVDAAFREGMPVEEIPIWSDEYFSMLERHPDLGAIFTLGANTVFVFEGKAYKITG